MSKHKLLAAGFGAIGIATLAIHSHEAMPAPQETTAVTVEYNYQPDEVDIELFGKLALGAAESQDTKQDAHTQRRFYDEKQFVKSSELAMAIPEVSDEQAPVAPLVQPQELPKEPQHEIEAVERVVPTIPGPPIEVNPPAHKGGGGGTDVAPPIPDTCETENPAIDALEFDHHAKLADIEAQILSAEVTDLGTLNEKLAQLGELYGTDLSIVIAGGEAAIDPLHYRPYTITGVQLGEELNIESVKQGLSVLIKDMKDISPELFALTSLDAIHLYGDLNGFNGQSLGGFVSDGRYMAMNVAVHQGLFIHEFEHALADSLCGFNDFYLDGALQAHNTQEYTGLFTGKSLDPKYFTASKEREFASLYGASNVAEDRAEIIQSLLTYRGLVREGDPDYESPFDKKQQILVDRIEAVAPGFRNLIEKRTDEIRSREDFIIPIHKTQEEYDQEYRARIEGIVKEGLSNGAQALYYENTIYAEKDTENNVWKVIINPILNVTTNQKGGSDSYYSFTSVAKIDNELTVTTLTRNPEEEADIFTIDGLAGLIQQDDQYFEDGLLYGTEARQPIGKYAEMTDTELQEYLKQNPDYQKYIPASPSVQK